MARNYDRDFPPDTKRITTGCQYCAVGCGYNALLAPEPDTEQEQLDDLSRFITPAMRSVVNFQGVKQLAAVAPDIRCDLNKGNHSVRGGSQGHNLVTHDRSGRSTEDRLRSPMVRIAKEDDPRGELVSITWAELNEIMAQLVIQAADLKVVGSGDNAQLQVNRPEGLGVKLYEYQYLENTYAATKLFYSCLSTPNVAYHDRPSAAGSSPGLADVGFRPHDFSYDEVRQADVLVFIGTNPYENQSVFFMQYCVGKEMIVIDPRRTATAQYAVETGGLHLQPTSLGADSLVLYALAREILERWEAAGHTLAEFPLRENMGDPMALPVDDPTEKGKAEKRRRKSRATDLTGFSEFLRGDDAPYSLENAEVVSGITADLLGEVVSRIFNPTKTTLSDQPKVAIFYEKGMIWGFNYQNTAAVGSLGLLLGAYSEPGRLVGRVGGHQKGWAEHRRKIDFVQNSNRNGYPFRNATDRYTDEHLQDLGLDTAEISVHHNIDNHVFGVDPDEIVENVSARKVKLRNGLTTRKHPDVRLLWIIGGNYLGQTNDCQRKRNVLDGRLRAGGDRGIMRPENSSVAEVVRVLGDRMRAGSSERKGVVLVHQDLFPSPTTELCDIVIPAAGWGEDTFCRYNAQRRLKLYDRFQDMPLHDDDAARIDGDPFDSIDDPDKFQHSPKPDWMIFRDIAQAIGRARDADNSTTISDHMQNAFGWQNSSEVADEMAVDSHRGLAHKQVDGGEAPLSLLGDIYLYGRDARAIPAEEGILHRVLGKKLGDDKRDALAPLLSGKNAKDKPYYSIPDESDIFGNGIATNGVLLPARGINSDGDVVGKDGAVGPVVRLHGTLRVDRRPQYGFVFIKAPWSEIEGVFIEFNPTDGNANELFLTNGRFNHLWNNMFHHLRNDYVNERFPEDLPGTILEVNPDWADQQLPRIVDGDVVKVKSGSNEFTAVASLQDSVPPSGCFAMFSYPVREPAGEELVFNFDGYANNASHGYADGINPIAALKYGRAMVVKSDEHELPYKSPRLDGMRERLGPTYEPRSVIAQVPQVRFSVSIGFQSDLDQRRFRQGLRDDFAAGGVDLPDDVEVTVIEPGQRWYVQAVLDGGRADRYLVTNALDHLAVKLDRWGSQRRLNWEMRELIVMKGLPRAFVGRHVSLGVSPRFLDPNQFIKNMLANTGDIRDFFSDELDDMREPRNTMLPPIDLWSNLERSIAENWLTSVGDGEDQPEEDSSDGGGDGESADPHEAMLALIRKKRDDEGAASLHGGVPIGGGQHLSDLFADETELLGYLESADPIQNNVPGHEGQPLVTPGDPDKSVLYQLIVHDDGIMNGTFDEEETKTVERWIRSLERPDQEGGPMKSVMLLPPFVIGRVGSADEPVVNFEFQEAASAPDEPVRMQIVPAETIFVERATGRVEEIRVPGEDELRFKESNDKIRPVAPFLEVWAEFDGEDQPRRVTQDDLDAGQLTVTWDVTLANWKAFRRTQNDDDKITAELTGHSHSIGVPQALLGAAGNFLDNTSIPMGFFQCLLIDNDHRELRARFLPPVGTVYGPAGDTSVTSVLRAGTSWTQHNDNSIPGSGPDDYFPPRTIPWLTYAGEESGGPGISRGYLDDTSDGDITVHVNGPGVALSARARIAVGPAHFAPDRKQFRSLADDFEFLEFGKDSEVVVPDTYVVELVEKALDNAEVLQLAWAKARSGWARFGGQNVTFDPDEAREVHVELLEDARELLAGNEQGIFRNRPRFLRAIRQPAESEGGRKMPLYMVGQNRAPMWLTPKQYERLRTWSEQDVGDVPPTDGDGDSGQIDPAQAKADMLALIRKKRDDDDAAREHRRVRLPDDRRLSELFADEEELLNYLLANKAIRNPIPGLEDELLVTPRDLDKSVLYQLIVDPDEGAMFGEFTDDEIEVIERWIMSLPTN